MRIQPSILYAVMALLFLLVGFIQSWQLSLTIFNLCLISSVMSLGVNLQWGVAGMFNVGTMGSAAIGGLAVVLISASPVPEAWEAGGMGVMFSGLLLLLTIALAIGVAKMMSGHRLKLLVIVIILLVGLTITRMVFFPATAAIESVDAASTGYLGGLGLPVVLSWLVGGLFAALLAWPVGRLVSGLRSDYLAVATFGISEIILAVLRNEEWVARGVKNVTRLPRPVPYENELQSLEWVLNLAKWADLPIREMASILVKLAYAGWFLCVLLIIYFLLQRLQRSPWGRMMRAIRDDEEAARAMGKNVGRRHMQAFVIGSAIVGIGGAMLVTLDSQFTVTGYQPLRFTFLIWLMVIIGGSGNHRGAIFGSFLIWFLWVEAETLGHGLAWLVGVILTPENSISIALKEGAAQLRYVVMGSILVLVMRFAPRGLIPEEQKSFAHDKR